MTYRERFIATVLGDPVDRPPYWLYWGPWGTTWQRWLSETTAEEIQRCRDQFNADAVPRLVPVNYGPCPRREPVLLDEDETTRTYLDTWGVKRMDLKTGESMSQFIEFPVKTREDWEAYKTQWLDPHHPGRLAGDWREQCAAFMEQGMPIQLGSFPDVGLFGGLRWLLGDEECLMAFCTMPDLVHDIMDHLTTLYLTVFEAVVQEVRVDVIHLWEDMCGRQGPLIGPDQWNAFMGPGYQRIKAFADEHGIPVISVDTDGNPDVIARCMIDAGVNLLFPMEVAAGCDVNDWRKRYPALALLGGVDKRVLAHGPAAIDAELERVRPAVESGRYIPTLDHCIPHDVSWDNYRYYAEALKRLVGKL